MRDEIKEATAEITRLHRELVETLREAYADDEEGADRAVTVLEAYYEAAYAQGFTVAAWEASH